MRLYKLLIENIRSYEKADINFEEGFNCIVGGVGQGKSSILYALDFALMGRPIGVGYSYLLREGFSSGRVMLSFEHLGKRYIVTRTLRRKGESIGHDPEELELYIDDQRVAFDKVEAVAELLRKETGLDETLYRDVVWIRQERLKELLIIKPADRQRTIDELFGLTEFDEAYMALRPVESSYETESQILARDIGDLPSLERDYDKEAKRSVELEMKVADLSKEVESQKEAYQIALWRVNKLRRWKEKFDELTTSEKILENRYGTLKADLSSSNQSLAKLKQQIFSIRNQVSQTDAAIKGSLKQFALRRASIDGLLSEIERTESVRRSISNKIAVLDQEANMAQERTKSLQKEENCPLCKQPLKAAYKTDLLAHLEAHAKDSSQEATRLREELRNLDRKSELIEKAVREVRIQTELAKTRRSDLRSKVRERRPLLATIRRKQRGAMTTRRKISEAKRQTPKFDAVKFDSSQRAVDETFKAHQRAQANIGSLEENLRLQRIRVDELKTRLDEKHVKSSRLELVKETQGLVKTVRELYRSVRPHLRSDFIRELKPLVQRILDRLSKPEERLYVDVDNEYTPTLVASGRVRSLEHLSGGERTFVALSLRLGLSHQIFTAKTGNLPEFLVLDEPTESLGVEDGSIMRLAEALRSLPEYKQIIAVTHSEELASYADWVIRVSKMTEKSRIELPKLEGRPTSAVT